MKKNTLNRFLVPAVVTMILMLCACCFSVRSHAATIYWTINACDTREHAGYDAAVNGNVPAQVQVDIVTSDSGNGWTQIGYQGRNGWIPTSNIRMSTSNNSSATYSTSSIATDYNSYTRAGYYTVTTANLNLRSGPSTGYPVIVQIPNGSQVYVHSYGNNGWAYIYYGSQYTGYVSTQYLSSFNGGSSNTGSSSGNYNGQTFQVGVYNVNLRSGPSTDYSVLTVVPGGSYVNVYDVSNGWAHVTYAGYNGYISSSYIIGFGGSSSLNDGSSSGSTTTGTTYYNGYNLANVYNYNYYRANNPDVVNAVGTDANALIAHFYNYGMSEGRQGCSSFNVYSYRDQHPDLQARFGSDLRSYYLYACGY